jgi:PAT family beta-lactamase induction signal transducer AmpG
MADAPALTRNPWAFIPLLYLMQAMPVTLIQEVSVVVYKDLGIADAEIAKWTSLIALPWSLQMLLGPFVDLSFTKRGWILGAQSIIAIGLILSAFLLRTPNAFGFSLVVLGCTAVMSALCNIATDGFAILSMTRTQQAQFAGIMSTFYRLGRLFCASLLVFIAGKLIEAGESKPQTWFLVLSIAVIVYVLLHVLSRIYLPREKVEPGMDRAPAATEKLTTNLIRTVSLLLTGIGGYFLLNAALRVLLNTQAERYPGWKLPETNQIPWLGGLSFGPVGTELAQLVACSVIVGCGLVVIRRTFKGSELSEALGSFLRQPGFPAILFFILFYRFGEAMVGKISVLFLKGAAADGGLALPNDQIGILNGLLGVVGIICGGIIGGLVVSKIGLRRSFLPLALAMHVPNLLYLLASYHLLPNTQPYVAGDPLNFTIGGILFVDQFGYGFGFAGYMVYLMWVAQRGKFTTSHYAIGTGMGALCIASAGVLSGVVVANWGYQGVFWTVIFASIPGLLSLLWVPLDESHKAIRVEVD